MVLVLPLMLLILLCLTVFDSRLNHFKERGDDVDQPINSSKDPLLVLNGLITRGKIKVLK